MTEFFKSEPTIAILIFRFKAKIKENIVRKDVCRRN